MLEPGSRRSTRRRTVAGDKGYDTRDFVARAREAGLTPHVADKTPPGNAPLSTLAPPATRGHASQPGGSANASRSPSAGSRPSPEDASSATSVEPATGLGSRITTAVYNLLRITALDTAPA